MAPPITCACGECQKCKHRAYMRIWYAKNAERHRVTARESRNRNIDKVRERDRARGFRSDKIKAKARRQVSMAIERGEINKGTCERILEGECDGRIEAHHEDYSRPLEITWLCVKHHRELDRKY